LEAQHLEEDHMAVKTYGAVITAPGKVEFQEITIPDPRPNDLLVDVVYSGVSMGTERWWFTGKRPDFPYPNVIGYQNVGYVAEVGKEVSGDWRVGDRVALGSSRLEPPLAGTGGHVRRAVDAASRAVKIPDGIGFEEAAIHWLFAVGYRGVKMCEIGSGDLVVCIGLGVIGQGFCQIARLRGATVIGADVLDSRCELGRLYSCDEAVNPEQQDLKAAVLARSPKGADVVVEAIGRTELIDLCVELVRPMGKIVWQGWYPGEARFNFHAAHVKRVTMYFPWYLEGQEEVLRLTKEGRLHAAPFVSRIFPARECAEAYRIMVEEPQSVMTMLLQWRAE
jgi:2-desacetyl-2-hydroxyethyl bacteriochlorophyllide A dehydrogenase